MHAYACYIINCYKELYFFAGPFENSSISPTTQYFTNASGYRHLNVTCWNNFSSVQVAFVFYAIDVPTSLQLVFSAPEVVSGSSASNSLSIYAIPASAVSLPASNAAASSVNATLLGVFFSCTMTTNGSLSLPLTLSTTNWTNGSNGLLSELYYVSESALGLSLLSVGPCELTVQCSSLYGNLNVNTSLPVLSNLSAALVFTSELPSPPYALRNASVVQSFSIADGSYLALNVTVYAAIVSPDITMSIAGLVLPINLTSSDAIATFAQPDYQFFSNFTHTFNLTFTVPGVYNVSFVFAVPNHPEQTSLQSSLLVVEDACSDGNYQFLTFLNMSVAGTITYSGATTIGT